MIMMRTNNTFKIKKDTSHYERALKMIVMDGVHNYENKSKNDISGKK